MTNRQYTEDEIEAAISKALRDPQKTLCIRDYVMAELNKPKQSFRDGEIVCNKSFNQPVRYNPRNCPDDFRHLKYAELPQYVHDLFGGVHNAATGKISPHKIVEDYLWASIEAFNAASGRGEE